MEKWICKHCKEEFDFTTNSQKANHSRWCEKNPKRDDWNRNHGGGFGEIKKFKVVCEMCGKEFHVKERETLFPRKEKYYCNRSCSNKVGGLVNGKKSSPDENANYRTVCWRHHEKKCIVCGEKNIVAAHHNDENHSNNDKKNFIPLCPTHHCYVHSRFKYLISPFIIKYLKEKWKE